MYDLSRYVQAQTSDELFNVGRNLTEAQVVDFILKAESDGTDFVVFPIIGPENVYGVPEYDAPVNGASFLEAIRARPQVKSGRVSTAQENYNGRGEVVREFESLYTRCMNVAHTAAHIDGENEVFEYRLPDCTAVLKRALNGHRVHMTVAYDHGRVYEYERTEWGNNPLYTRVMYLGG